MHLVHQVTTLAASVAGLACLYAMSSEVLAQAEQNEVVILMRLHVLSVRIQLSSSHGSDLLRRLSKLLCFPPVTLNSS